MAFKLNNSSSIALFVLLILSLYSSVSAQKLSGTATFTSPPYTPSACYEDVDKGVLVAGVTAEMYDGGNACGKIYFVSCVGDSPPCRPGIVPVTITDFCDSDDCGTLNLSKDAFMAIAESVEGVIDISYQLLGT